MTYTKKQWLEHPGHNPAHRFEGRERTKIKLPDGNEIIKRGPRNPSRWVPHRGKKERSEAQ